MAALGLALVPVFALGRAGPVPEVGSIAPVYASVDEKLAVHRLGPGETFGVVLSRAGLETNDQSGLLLAFREVASPRRMRVGTEITFRHAPAGTLRGIDVGLTQDETVRLTREPLGWRSAVIETPAWTDTVSVVGTIRSSLWTSLVDNPGLASFPGGDQHRVIGHLDKIFQWQIDLSRQIHEGDFYRFVFEREVRPDGSMRTGRVLAAELVNQGRSLVAIWFDPDGDGKGTYYDLDGQSVRRAFLKAPLEFLRISSRFSNARLHPVLGTWRAHRGVDYAAPRGTEVRATADGVVMKRAVEGGYGNLVEVQHANGFRTRYAHLSGFATGVRVGSRVGQAEVIGYVGQTGLATGPHLHYELLQEGRHVDPLTIELPQGDPVPEEAWEAWEGQRDPHLGLLLRLPDHRTYGVSAMGPTPMATVPAPDDSGLDPGLEPPSPR